MMTIFVRRKAIESLSPKLAADAGRLPSAEGQRVIVDQWVVDPYHAGLQPLRRLHRLGEVGGEDRGTQSERAVIGEPDRLVEIADTADRRRPGRSTLPCRSPCPASRRSGSSARRTSRHYALGGTRPPVDALSAPCATASSTSRITFGACGLADQRSDLGLVHSVADAQRPRLLGEQLDKAIMHGIDDEEALGRGADLAGEMEGGRHRAAPPRPPAAHGR